MFSNNQKIGLALSGGGFRAAIFHLGILKFLAETCEFENIKSVSTVSGASIGMSMILCINGYRWPTNKEYLQKVLPECENIILNHDIGNAILALKEKYPEMDTSLVLAKALEEEWGVYGDLQNIPSSLDWEINSTVFETAENFIFSKVKMGGEILGYAINPDFKVSQAVAASAAYPELIGTYLLDITPYKWYKDSCGNIPIDNPPEACHLWDGGVCDNLGLKALYKPRCGLKEGIDYLIVSDASSPIYAQEYFDDGSFLNLKRIWDISVKELNSLLLNNLFYDVINKGCGVYLKTGIFMGDVLKRIPMRKEASLKLLETSLSQEKVKLVENFPTNLNSPTKEEFNLILRHGYETGICFKLASKFSNLR